MQSGRGVRFRKASLYCDLGHIVASRGSDEGKDGEESTKFNMGLFEIVPLVLSSHNSNPKFEIRYIIL